MLTGQYHVGAETPQVHRYVLSQSFILPLISFQRLRSFSFPLEKKTFCRAAFPCFNSPPFGITVNNSGLCRALQVKTFQQRRRRLHPSLPPLLFFFFSFSFKMSARLFAIVCLAVAAAAALLWVSAGVSLVSDAASHLEMSFHPRPKFIIYHFPFSLCAGGKCSRRRRHVRGRSSSSAGTNGSAIGAFLCNHI